MTCVISAFTCLSKCGITSHAFSLGPHQVLVFEGRSLQVDNPLGPQGDLEDTTNLDVYLCRTQDHNVVVLQQKKSLIFMYGIKNQ